MMRALLIEIKERFPHVKIEAEVKEDFIVWYIYNVPFPGDRGKMMKKKEGYIFEVAHGLELGIEEILRKVFYGGA